MIKPIPTQYQGYRFRSRNEARWAVFFETLQLDWRYEVEGYELTHRKRNERRCTNGGGMSARVMWADHADGCVYPERNEPDDIPVLVLPIIEGPDGVDSIGPFLAVGSRDEEVAVTALFDMVEAALRGGDDE